MFVGCITAFGRENNNPTVGQFQAAFERLLLRTVTKSATTTGNCIALDDISTILSATSTFEPEESINQTCTTDRMIDNYKIDIERYVNQILVQHGHSYIAAFTCNVIDFSQYCTEVTSYTAGFIIKHLMKYLK